MAERSAGQRNLERITACGNAKNKRKENDILNIPHESDADVSASPSLTLGQCLNMLHHDLVLVDMKSPGKPTHPVSKWKKLLPLDEPGYELRTMSFNHGRTQKKSIVQIDGAKAWHEW